MADEPTICVNRGGTQEEEGRLLTTILRLRDVVARDASARAALKQAIQRDCVHAAYHVDHAPAAHASCFEAVLMILREVDNERATAATTIACAHRLLAMTHVSTMLAVPWPLNPSVFSNHVRIWVDMYSTDAPADVVITQADFHALSGERVTLRPAAPPSVAS